MIVCALVIGARPLSAQNWVSNSVPPFSWQWLASSANGNVLVTAVNNYGPIYTSTNSGTDWTSNNAPNYAWNAVVSSADGTKLAAAGPGAYMSPTAIFTSTNSGASWGQVSTLPSAETCEMASSADGSRLALTGWDMPIYVSTNSGVSWTPTGTPNQYTTVASSADGTKLVAAGWNASVIYVSTNGGAIWTTHGAGEALWGSACSADGSKMVVIGRGEPIYLSRDSGTTWTEPTNAPQTDWLSVAMSADGKKIFAYEDMDNLIYSSTDGGCSWTSSSPPAFGLSALVCSADGNKLAAAGYNAIYTTYSPPAPQLNADSSGVLSWIVASTNFAVQESADLATGNWNTLTNSPVLNPTTVRDEVQLSPSSNSGFYRLISQ